MIFIPAGHFYAFKVEDGPVMLSYERQLTPQSLYQGMGAMCTILKDRHNDSMRAKRYIGTTWRMQPQHLQMYIDQANLEYGPDINRELDIRGPTSSSGYRLNMDTYDRCSSHNRLKGICMQNLGVIGFYGMHGKIFLPGMNLRSWGDLCTWASAHMGISGYQLEHERRGARPRVERQEKEREHDEDEDEDEGGAGPSSRGRGRRGGRGGRRGRDGRGGRGDRGGRGGASGSASGSKRKAAQGPGEDQEFRRSGRLSSPVK